MSTVTFNCPQCGKLMGVSLEYLGQQVRCPHCKQVIPAPGTDKPAAPKETPPAQPHRIEDSIFEAADENAGDALFASSVKSLVEMPPEPAAPNLQIEATPGQPPVPPLQVEAAGGLLPSQEPTIADAGGPPKSEPAYEATVTYLAPEPGAGPPLPQVLPPNLGERSPGEGVGPGMSPAEGPLPGDAPRSSASDLHFGVTPATDRTAGSASSIAGTHEPVRDDGPLSTMAGRSGRQRPGRGGMLGPTLLIFLIPYSLVTTVAVILLFMRKPEPSLEVLPDPAPNPKSGGPARKSPREQLRVRIDLKVPPNLAAPLRQTITVGDLVVVPQKVERLPGDQLRLTLSMRNRSEDVEFNPVSDSYLRVDSYTYLEFLNREERIYGGYWLATRKGQPFDGRLGPGQSLTAQLTTGVDSRRKVKTVQPGGRFLWRVQVRRGFMKVRGKDVSATAVIGVEFSGRDVTSGREDDKEDDQARAPSQPPRLALSPRTGKG